MIENFLQGSISATRKGVSNSSVNFNINHSKEIIEYLRKLNNDLTFKFVGEASTGLKLISCSPTDEGARKINLRRNNRTKEYDGRGTTHISNKFIGLPNVVFKAMPIKLKKIPEGLEFPPLSEDNIHKLIEEQIKESEPTNLKNLDNHDLDDKNTAGHDLQMTEEQIDDGIRREIDRLEHQGRPSMDQSLRDVEESFRANGFSGNINIEGKFKIQIKD